MLAFGLVASLLPEPGPAAVVPPSVPVVAPPPPPVQAQVVPAGPVVVRDKVLNRLADAHLVALTFDDGPDPKWTPQILAVLHRYGAVATFCEIGRNVQANPSLVSQIVEAGNQLCDHTMTHDERLPDK